MSSTTKTMANDALARNTQTLSEKTAVDAEIARRTRYGLDVTDLTAQSDALDTRSTRLIAEAAILNV